MYAHQNLWYVACLPLLGGRARVMTECIFVKQHDEVLQFAMTTKTVINLFTMRLS